MPNYTVQDLYNDLIAVLHGTTLNQIVNPEGLVYRAARKLLLDVDPQETIRELPFTVPIFTGAFEYPLAPDVKGISIIDIRPQVNRGYRDVFNQDYSQEFNLSAQPNANGNVQSQFNIKFNSGIKTIELNSATAPAPILVNSANSVTDNGTWVAGGAASAPTVNNINWVGNGGSLQFDIAAGSNPTLATLTNSTQQAVDLTYQANQSSFFAWVYMPDASVFNDVTLRWGSSASDYWTKTVTTTQSGTVFQTGWNQLQFDWSPTTSTTAGSPDASSITYLQLRLNTDGTEQVGVLFNFVNDAMGQILNYLYYSKYLFRDAITGAFQETVTDSSNIINLDVESYSLLTYQAAFLASQQQQGKNATVYDGKFLLKQYEDAVDKYKLRYKSQIQKPRLIYYKQPNPRYGWGATGPWWPL